MILINNIVCHMLICDMNYDLYNDFLNYNKIKYLELKL